MCVCVGVCGGVHVCTYICFCVCVCVCPVLVHCPADSSDEYLTASECSSLYGDLKGTVLVY